MDDDPPSDHLGPPEEKVTRLSVLPGPLAGDDSRQLPDDGDSEPTSSFVSGDLHVTLPEARSLIPLPRPKALDLLTAEVDLLPSLRRSPRLATKLSGDKKSSLQRVQELRCKKYKMVHFAPNVLCSTSSPPLVVNPLPIPLGSHPPQRRTEGLPPDALLTSTSPASTSTPKRNTELPLTPGEIQQIMDSCGITHKGSGLSLLLTNPTADGAGGAGAAADGV